MLVIKQQILKEAHNFQNLEKIWKSSMFATDKNQ